MDISQEILSNITVYMKYAKYLPEKQRRETWEELVSRNKEMNLAKFPDLKNEIEDAYKFVYEKKVLPSMRMLQFSGKPIEINPVRGYNCSYTHVNHIKVFSEIMFLLLCGTGVGYSVQKHHIAELPPIRKPQPDRAYGTRRFLVPDSIEGWADAVDMLIQSFFKGGPDIIFDFRDIRPKGTLLKTTGGKAPGPEPLKIALRQVKSILNEKQDGDFLKPIEVHDILCHLADAVLAGGVRRSAMISLFSVDDEDMISCKSGDWWENNPQRGRANNSAVIVRHMIDEKTFFDLWKRVEASGAGEPGLFFTHDKDIGTNPCCVSGDTTVLTDKGVFQVKDLVNKSFTVSMGGEEYKTISKGFWKTGKKEIYKIITKFGFETKATKDHRFLTVDGWKEIQNLHIGDKMKIAKHVPKKWNGEGNFDEGWILGSLVGDGTFGVKDGQIQFWNDPGNGSYEAKRMAEIALERVSSLPGLKKELKIRKKQEEGKYIIGSVAIKKLAEKYGIFRVEKKITSKIECASSDFIRGFLRGFFDADGSVQGTKEKGVSVRLGQVDLDKLKAVQRMLLRLGIFSKIYKNRRKEGFYVLPDGKGGEKEYLCQTSHELIISRTEIKKFAEIVGFEDNKKMSCLLEHLSSYKRNLYQQVFEDEIESIQMIGEEDVYDVSVEDIHCFDADGLIAHNCEISLNHQQFCNLTEINGGLTETQDDLNKAAKAAAFIGTLQASYTDFHYLRPGWKKQTEKEALLGIGITGIGAGKVQKLNLEEAAEIAVEENKRISKIIGINPAARVTTIKPSGTSSLVLGTSSGVHAFHSPYYLRRIRVGKNEDIYHYLYVNHNELVEDEFFKPHQQAVITIPQKATKEALLRTETAFELLERVKDFHLRWIKPGHQTGVNTHNVSATVSIKPDEWEQVGRWMWENRNHYNGLSVLPYSDHTYKQAPFEECDEETYNRLFQSLQNVDLTKIVEVGDNTNLTGEAACAGGKCEIV